MLFPVRCGVGLFLLLFGLTIYGQAPLHQSYLSVEIANDVFYLPLKTDRYFTSGMALEWGTERRLRIGQNGHEPMTKCRYWRINQDLFTPNAIDSLQLMPGDRPFASYLTLSRGQRVTLPGLGLRMGWEWTGGVLGRYSFGGRMQNAFHGMIDFADEIPGWVHEVKPDVVINGQFFLERSFIISQRDRLSFGTRARVGTLYTDLRPQAVISNRWVRLGRRGYLGTRLEGSVRFVGYNATLSGGLFNRDGRYRGVVQPRRLVSSLGGSGGIYLPGFRIEAGVRWLSPEFRGGMEHLWAWFGASTR